MTDFSSDPVNGMVGDCNNIAITLAFGENAGEDENGVWARQLYGNMIAILETVKDATTNLYPPYQIKKAFHLID
mgnify:CR=1 FL=1